LARRREVPRREFFWPGAPLPKSGASALREPRAMATNPFEFLQQVRSEASKVVWPSRRETMVTTGMVMLMVVFTSLFFLVVDELLRIAVGLALGIGRGG
jgi:preprotein translocase subunit SecE